MHTLKALGLFIGRSLLILSLPVIAIFTLIASLWLTCWEDAE